MTKLTFFHKNTTNQEQQEKYFKIIIKHEKPTVNIIFNSEKLKAFPIIIRNKARMLTLTYLSNTVLDILVREIRQEKE